MIKIPVVKNVGGQWFKLAYCYDRAKTAKGRISKIRKDNGQAFLDSVVVAQKVLYLVYVR